MNITTIRRETFFRQLKTTATRLGKVTGFILRRRKITAYSYFMMLSFGTLGRKYPCLEGMANFLNLTVSREAIHKRFSFQGASFMLAMLEHILGLALAVKIRINCAILQPFSSIQIFDSSGYELHRNLKNVFRGTGGSASPAACKIHVAYEPQAARIIAFELTRGAYSDSEWLHSHLTKSGAVQQNNLLLFDQGYFSVNNLIAIVKRKAFFLTRFFLSISIFDALTKARIDLQAELSDCSQSQKEFNVLLGPTKALQCRLVCLRVTPLQAEKRRTKYKAIEQKRGKTFSQATLFFCDWTLLLTNIPYESVPIDFLYSIYRVRWQIELFFRSLKSILKINSIHTQNEFRVKCEIIGKISTAVLARYLLDVFGIRHFKSNDENSIEKLFKFFVERAFYWGQLLLKARRSLLCIVKKEFQQIAQSSIKIYQPSRKTSLEMLYFDS